MLIIFQASLEIKFRLQSVYNYIMKLLNIMEYLVAYILIFTIGKF